MTEVSQRGTPWLQEAAEKKRVATVKKLTEAMKAMELDIQANDNLYPFNGGAINQAEVCRRAGVAKALLQSPSHKTSTKTMVDTWVAEIKRRLVTGHKNVRRAVTARADNWKEHHDYLRNSYHIDMLKLEEAEAKIRTLTAENATFRDENAALREEIAKRSSNVRALSPKAKRMEQTPP